MTPLYLGDGDELFAVWHEAEPVHSPARHAVVLCPPIAAEYVSAHRTLRHLASVLARRGCDCLRFDYLGTGDSAGDSPSATLDRWRQDVHTAIDALPGLSHHGYVRRHLVGLRIGANLAALAASERDDIDSLVLWEPILDGVRYLEDRSEPSSAASADGYVEISGLPLSQETAAAIAALMPVPLSAPAQRVLVIDRATVRGIWSQSAWAPEEQVIPDCDIWEDPAGFGQGRIPLPVVSTIADWVARS